MPPALVSDWHLSTKLPSANTFSASSPLKNKTKTRSFKTSREKKNLAIRFHSNKSQKKKRLVAAEKHNKMQKTQSWLESYLKPTWTIQKRVAIVTHPGNDAPSNTAREWCLQAGGGRIGLLRAGLCRVGGSPSADHHWACKGAADQKPPIASMNIEVYLYFWQLPFGFQSWLL